MIPILDPGIKMETGYHVYDEGIIKKIFCKNPQGKEFVGFVWPGATVFPDFSIQEGRNWWSEHAETFLKNGFRGVWIDMNDPSLGSGEPESMLFNQGNDSHDSFHNQYAMGMAQATFSAFIKKAPDKRPFVLSRSGSPGINRYAALWTGDNFSNLHHLRSSIPISLNLALSGVPFNGPDIAGFGGNASGSLMSLWIKCAFLFPFLRNHSVKGSCEQEPWQYPRPVRNIIRHYIQMRYKLLPYLYNLFIQHEKTGSAILRPLFYDFKDDKKSEYSLVGDQFMVGPSILQAPILDDIKNERIALIPTGFWYSVSQSKWIAGGKNMKLNTGPTETPLFIRDGSIIPMQKGIRSHHFNDLAHIEFHVFLSEKNQKTIEYQYYYDDGESFDYKKGNEGLIELKLTLRNKRTYGLYKI